MPVFLRWLLRLGPTNPISVRLIQNGSKRAKHMYIRAAYLAVLILVLLWSLLTLTQAGALSYRALAAAGAASFTYVAYLQIVLICVLAPVFMASAIAQESSPRTWDIMLTTPLSAVQIVLGNLIGRLFFVLALLFASLPLFAITQYFGGVPGRSIFASYLIAAGAALLVGTIAVALAVSRLVGRRAVFAFYVSVVTYLAITAGLDAWLRGSGRGVGGSGVTWMTAINPFLALRALLSPSSYPRADPETVGLAGWFLARPVTTWCLLSTSLSLLLAVLSTFTVRRGGLQSLAGESSGGVPWYRRMFGLGAAGSEHRPPRGVWHNPIAWREAAARNSTLGRIVMRWLFIASGGAFGIALVVLFHTGTLTTSDFQLAVMTTVWGELAVVALVAINMSATAVSREREDGTLDLLLTTPITPGEYLSGKLRGLIAYLLPLLAVPLGTVAAAGLYVALDGLGSGGVTLSANMPGPGRLNYPVILPEAALTLPLVVIPFMAFCSVVGLHWSLKSKGTIASVVATVGLVGVVSGIVGLCGWRSGTDLSLLGPVLAGLSPGSLLYACLDPVDAMAQTVMNASSSGLTQARISLAIGAAVGGACYAGVVYAMHASMVRNFDMTVRKLAGVK